MLVESACLSSPTLRLHSKSAQEVLVNYSPLTESATGLVWSLSQADLGTILLVGQIPLYHYTPLYLSGFQLAHEQRDPHKNDHSLDLTSIHRDHLDRDQGMFQI